MECGGHVIKIHSGSDQTDTHSSEAGISKYNFDMDGCGVVELDETKIQADYLCNFLDRYEKHWV